jgi:hypothetical protein
MKQHVGKLIILVIVMGFVFTACGGGSTEGTDAGDAGEAEVDPDTGLLINPDVAPEGPFIVDGEINSLNLTPQTSPEFVIRVDSGKTYRIRSQGLAETYFDDGEPVTPSLIRQGVRARATVTYDPVRLLYFSEDLIFIKEAEE